MVDEDYTSPHGYNAKAYGARCDVCPLGPKGFLHDRSKPYCPVGPEWHQGTQTIAVVEKPGDDEVRLGYPLAGRSGAQEWNPGLQSIGRKRTDVSLTHVVACACPGDASGAYKRMERTIKAENERLKKEATAPSGGFEPHQWPSPADCCKPRLAWELGHYRNILVLGGTAAKSVLHATQGIHAIAGGPVELPSGHKVLPTFDPAYVLHAPQDREIWQADLAKAFRYFEGTRNWVEPYYTWKPTPAELRAWLAVAARFWAYDYETDSKDPIRAGVDCLSFATMVDGGQEVTCEKCGGTGRRRMTFTPGDGWVTTPADQRHLECVCCGGAGRRRITMRMLLVPFRSVEDRSRRFYNFADEAEILQICREFFEDPTRWKIAHNGLGYDEFVTHQFLKARTYPRRDTIPIARSCAPDRKKSLGIVGRIYTDVQAWKADSEGKKIANNAKRDGQLHYYCAVDSCVTAAITDPLTAQATSRGYFRPLPEVLKPIGFASHLPWTLEGFDIHRAEMCQEMRYNGLWIDQKRRAAHIQRLDGEVEHYRALAEQYAASLGITGPAIGNGNPRAACTKCGRNCASRGGYPWFHRGKNGLPCPGNKILGHPASGFEPFNPGSQAQIASIIFDAWGNIPTKFSEETGKVSVDDEVLRDILCQPDLEFDREVFIDAVRRYMRARKAKSTFLRPLALRKGWIPRYKLDKSGKRVSEKPMNDEPLVWDDGRARPYITAIITSVARLNSSEFNCFDGATEILTREGWTRFDALPRGVEVAQWQDGAVTFTLPTAYIEKPYCGDMIHVNNDHIDLFMTPDHRCLVERGPTGERRVVPAADYPDAGWKQLHAGLHTGQRAVHPAAVTLLCAMQADGSWTSGGGLDFGFSKQRKIDRLEAALIALEIPFTSAPRNRGGTRFYVRKANVPAWLHVLGPQKHFGPWLLEWDLATLTCFADETMHWDGCITRKTCYASSERVNADWVQAAFTLTGRRAILRKVRQPVHTCDSWQVWVTPRDNSWTTNRKLARVPYDGTIYCVSVPSSFIVVRRNGRVCITGQSQNYPLIFRDVVAAQPIYPEGDPRYPGRVLMSGDIDQFHLRIIANRWGVARLLQGFVDLLDPHCMLAYDFFGAKFKHASGWGPDGFSLKQALKPDKGSDAGKMRDIAKVIRYQGAYADVPEGIFVSVRKVENKETGDMPFKDFTLREVRRMYKIWMRAEPEWESAWERVLDQYKRNGGWIEEAVLGRRSGGLEDGKKQAVVNYDILACEPSAMGMIESAVRAAFPFGHNGPGTGIIAQVHDSLTVETEGFAWLEKVNGKKRVVCDPATDKKRQIMQEAMNGVKIPGWVIPITSEIGVGPVRDLAGKPMLSNWKDA